MAKSSAQVIAEAKVQMTNAEQRKKELVKHYKEEELVPMYLSPMYKPHFGNVMTVTINGISIYFPVNGQTYKVPKTFADEIAGRRMAVDAITNKQTQASRITQNVESSPGEIKLF